VEHGKPHGLSVQPTQPAARQAKTQGVEDVGGSEGPPVIGGIGPPLVGGETQPARVLTAHGSSRTRRRKGHGRHGPHGRAASGTERPWLSTHGPQRNGSSKACAFGSSERPVLRQVNRLERHVGKLARAVLRGRGPGDRLLLPDPPLRFRFRQRLTPGVRRRRRRRKIQKKPFTTSRHSVIHAQHV
jgi:hypothetical protein